ncbi:MAG TPA: dienelactone hydrolase family protein [Actinomycetota bacterium]|nr:dienelactone hydrolase family protein [Actinomycetota bacterium]
MPDQDLYLAEPSGPARAGVLVVHDWYGRLPHVRAAADELAAAGLAAAAPDLYGGQTAADPEQAEALANGMDRAAAPGRVDGAVKALRARVEGGPVGVLGWSLGGMYALDRATAGDIDAAASYYAFLEEDDAAKLHCPVLLHLAETDEFDPPEYYEQFVAALRAAGTEVEVHTWPGTEHSFANGDVPLHAPGQAAEAWAITVGFLRRHLLGPQAG